LSHVIPKREVPVRIHLATGEVLSGVMFLDFIDVIHRGEQTLLDKCNDDYQWFPLRMRDGTTEIVNRNRVVLVEPGDGLPEELVRKESGGVFRREAVGVRLAAGRMMEGRIAMDLPDEFCRVSDFLNFPQDFFALETETGPVLVAKHHVVALRALEAPPAVPGMRDAGIGEHA
jgi:hypothetical protein